MDARDRSLRELEKELRFAGPVYVARPSMPRLEDFVDLIGTIWESGRLTNNGPLHRKLEQSLGDFLGVDHVNLLCNGTTALLVALKELGIDGGEVITTPFTFPATVHVLSWSKIRPVFCDIDAKTFTLDPERLEALIGPETRAVMPIHIYGNPCDVDGIQAVADRHGLKVIYDAAHAMGARYRGKSIVEFGDVSVLSFHGTKPFSTLEGGAIVTRSRAQWERVNLLKNFGIADEETVVTPGINGKMNEIQAAFGLLQLDMVEEEIGLRKLLAGLYQKELNRVQGITCLQNLPGVEHNYSFFPVLVDGAAYGLTRDELYSALKRFNIMTRKYFFPLCSSYSCYSGLPSASPGNLAVAGDVSRKVLCLPIYGSLPPETAERICAVVARLPSTYRRP